MKWRTIVLLKAVPVVTHNFKLWSKDNNNDEKMCEKEI